MIFRIASVWIAVASASIVSVICYAFAGSIGYSEFGPFELPLISKFFYPDSIFLYLYPIPLVILALVHTIRTRDTKDHSHFLVAVTLSLTFVFLAAFLLAIALPFTPQSPKHLRGEQAEAGRPHTAP